MSRENVELVRRTAELFASKGIDASLEYTAEDVIAYPFPEWADNFDDIRLEPEEFFDAGDRS